MFISVRSLLSSSLHDHFSLRFLALLCVILGLTDRAAAQGIIFVTSVEQKISTTGGCSLQEAIYSSIYHSNVAISGYDAQSNNFPNVITTQCVAGTGNDRIILPTGVIFQMSSIVDDASNPFGPTATPLITSNITVVANGATLQHTGTANFRAFAVGSAGHLTIQNAYIKGFAAKGGDGGTGPLFFDGGGGGGMGAGGAIYVHAGSLLIENSTFEANGAIGGNGGVGDNDFGAGGGGLGGSGVPHQRTIFSTCGAGGGGGGSRGNGDAFCGGNSAVITAAFGGGGGGTVTGGSSQLAGFACGGTGGSDGGSGQDAPCPGGGGGGGSNKFLISSGDGGSGNYGGGGGGGANEGGNGGNGGFGGGGGAGVAGDFGGTRGGNGGFGGGGGVGPDGSIAGGGHPGPGGVFGGDGNSRTGGGGAGLGGAIFNDSGSVVVKNSTFTNNFVTRGVGGFGAAPGAGNNGADAGGAIFTVNGHLTVLNATISGNQGTGSGAGIVVYADASSASVFLLDNTIIANNGTEECYLRGPVTVDGSVGNLIMANGTGGLFAACPIVFSSDDPLLGPLQLDQGNTPTMAIPKTSPAFNAADGTTSLATDQRGVDRPQSSGFDIGAYELCVPRLPGDVPCQRLVDVLPPDTEPLTMQVSPAAGGTVNPAAGTHIETLDQVVPLVAMSNLGYVFTNWTGAPVGSMNSSSTFIIMNQPQTVTANFAALPTSMLGNIIAKAGPSNARVWTLSLLNNGPGGAYGVTVPSFTLTQTFGAACTPVISTSFPLPFADLAPAQTGTANVTIDFTGCAATARFTAKFTFTANGGAVSGFVVRGNQFQ